jgi:protein-S-isoprenylcysteine O-methyltransferase Ste14
MTIAPRTINIVCSVAAFSYASYNAWHFAETHAWPFLAQLIFGILVTGAFLLRRQETGAKQSIKTILITTSHILCPLLFRIELGQSTTLNTVSASLILIGAAISGFALIDLWDCFGLLPCYRGIQKSGLYRIVRHPIYFGYMIAASGGLLLSPTIRNGVIFTVFSLLSLTRISLEESHLSQTTSEYKEYQTTVKYRLIPGVI